MDDVSQKTPLLARCFTARRPPTAYRPGQSPRLQSLRDRDLELLRLGDRAHLHRDFVLAGCNELGALSAVGVQYVLGRLQVPDEPIEAGQRGVFEGGNGGSGWPFDRDGQRLA